MYLLLRGSPLENPPVKLMRRKKNRRLLPPIAVTIGALVLGSSTPLFAATFHYWRAGGDGNWGTGPGDKNWNTSSGAMSGNTAWPDTNEDVAVFNDSFGGTVTVFTQVRAGGIIQTGADYAINASTITLASSATGQPFIDVHGGTLTIDSILAGSDGAIKNGAGNLILSNASTFTGETRISGGSLTLTGTLDSTVVNIDPGATFFNVSGGLADTTALTNAGMLVINSAETVGTYVQNAGGSFTGSASLAATHGAVLNAGAVFGTLIGDVISTGDVFVSGTIDGDTLSVTGGHLTLEGVSTAVDVSVGSVGKLTVTTGGLDSSARFVNAGTLALGADERVLSYLSNGGTLAVGSGVLSTGQARLQSGSTVSGSLAADTLTSHGTVAVSGSVSAPEIFVASGTLTNTGTLGTASTLLDIASGASLVARGTQRYTLLTTSGSGAAIWRGDLKNGAAIAPGGQGSFGTLAVEGNFSQTAAGRLSLDISRARHDLLAVSGGVKFGGTLELNQIGGAIAPFVPLHVVDAGSYSGKFSSLVSNLDGAVWFNPRSGDVTLVSPNPGTALAGLTANQRSTWISLYDDVVDPGVTNVTPGPSGPIITSGIADSQNPDLLWALTSSFTPAGLNGELLNHLSPEVYVGFIDYAVQATRTHQRTALSAPAIPARSGPEKDSKGGLSKGGIVSPSVSDQWEFFAAADAFRIESDSSANQADSDLTGGGMLVGARTRVRDNLQLASYVGADWGTVDGSLIDSDAAGWSAGIILQMILNERTQTRVTAAVSHGRYDFDGTRESVSATALGWSPAGIRIPDVDTSATEWFAGVEGVAWEKRNLRVIPSAGLRYASSTLEGFRESNASTAGSPIALDVERDHQDSFLGEAAVTAEADLDEKTTVWGQIGLNADLLDNSHELHGSFVDGSRRFDTTADGMNDDLIFISLGAAYRVSDSISVGAGWRSEFRSDSDASQSFNISSSIRF